jgi:type II secretory pathway pseudopilin PulG
MKRPGGYEAGFSLVGAAAGITIMLTVMGMAMPAWRYVMQDDREEELLFRGGQIADGIGRYQKESKGLPVSMDVLVKKKFLRKAYTDPMTKHGQWRFIRPGELIPPQLGGPGRPSRPGEPNQAGPWRPMPSPSPGSAGLPTGPFMGVASMSKEKSLRMFNGRSQYDEWIFGVGLPRVVGKPPVIIPGAEASPGGGLPGPGPRPPKG